MCILFAYINNNPAPSGYQLIVAVNRDEYFARPTKPAHFWNNGNCISGVDAEPGREGGTWFGASTNGRIGALLNIAQVQVKDGLGRGYLVTDYLCNSRDGATYCRDLMKNGDQYNAFNLLLLEKQNNSWSAHYCCNMLNEPDRYKQIQIPSAISTAENNSLSHAWPVIEHLEYDGILAVSNSPIDRPWRKVITGRERFHHIINNVTTDQSDKLKSKLIELMSDRTSNMPDPVLEGQLMKGAFNEPLVQAARSAVCVDLQGRFPYGTRTHTILLIDSEGRCDFTESTMTEPIDQNNPLWNQQTHQYVLSSNHCTDSISNL